jgi:hydrogenase-4 component B
MQATAGSLADIAAGWFDGILRPVRSWRRPRGPFPGEAHLFGRTPDPVLLRVVGPAAAGVGGASGAARRLQHGRLPFYVLYVAVAVVALAALVWIGGAR